MRPIGRRKGWALEWWFAVLASGGAVLTAAVQVLSKVEAPTWLFVMLYVLAGAVAVTAAVVGVLKKRAEEKRAWAREVESYLELAPGRSRRLPRVSEVSPYQLGVSRSSYAPDEAERSDDAERSDPYVGRQEADGRLREALSSSESQFIILVGDSKSGKSRTMYEAVRKMLPETPLIVPVDEEAIGKLFSLDPPLDMHPTPGVLWLDDLDEARLGALTPALLDRLGSDVVIVASMTSQRRDRITRSDSDIGRIARQALDSAKKIHLDFELTDEERRDAEARYPGERFDHSIGEPLVAADQLVARFDAGRDARDDDSRPVGYALVRAAIDWRRAGLNRPIRDSELRALYPKYLASVRAGLEPSEDLYNRGLAWACEPVASHVALLEKVNLGEERGFVAFDYFVALLDGHHTHPRRDVLPALWDFVIESLSEEEMMPAGLTAYLRNDLVTAERVWRTVAAGSSRDAGEAAINLGLLLEEKDDTRGARAAYQMAIDSGHEDRAPRAAVNLGNLLGVQGDAEGARAAYQLAIDSGHQEVAPLAERLLSDLDS